MTRTTKTSLSVETLGAREMPAGVTASISGGVLTLTGERKAEFDSNEGTFHRSERAYGRFSRSFTLPATVDANRINATYRDGVLTIRVPQREEAKPKQIEVTEQ